MYSKPEQHQKYLSDQPAPEKQTKMRSTRHKLKILRGITRTSGSSATTPYRKHIHYQVSANFHRHSSPDNTTVNNHLAPELTNQASTSRPTRVKPCNQHPPVYFVSTSAATLQPLCSHSNGNSSHNSAGRQSDDSSTSQVPRPISNIAWIDIHSSVMDSDLNPDIRAKAFAICKDYLHGAWKHIDARDLVVKRISGGLSNYLYHCSLPQDLSPMYTEPTQVLLRFYGQIHGEGALESLITESVIFTLLSERKLGPRLYGVFPGGRVEEFIPARPLLTMELRDPELSCLIAQKMAQIHALNIPISKEPSWLWGTMGRWMANVKESLAKTSLKDSPKKDIIQRLIEFKLDDELCWLKKYLPKVNSPVVFSHNDLQEGNILIRPEYETPEDKLVLIDFEYCSYNYRGFDLANHFCEWSYNYNVDLYPNFQYTQKDFPSNEEMARFIRRYITILRQEYKLNFVEVDENFLNTSPLFDEEHIVREVEAFILASHFFWSLWAIVNAQVSKIPFGYWEYGLTRLEAYFALKQHLLGSQ